MYLSLNWLKDYVDIPRRITSEELASLLTMHTVEVEKVVKQAEKYNKVVVGRILEIKKHPQADRLQLVKVDIGKEKLDIVCGAGNIAEKMLVPVALVGAILPNGLVIKEVEVRGEKSSGMLCAPDELGLGEDHSGIFILEKKAKLGSSIADYLELKDTIIEVDNKSITHRGDLWGHYGMAREIAAFLQGRLKKELQSNLSDLKIETLSGKINLKVKVEDFSLCPRYLAVALKDIKIEPSPKWLTERLIAVGMRPINNIVDITNYVMLEIGQPLHAFDLSLIRANEKANNGECEIIVRPAKKGEIIETIDGEKRELSEGMTVIANEKKPVAIAGIMGGTESGINSQTDMIIIEAANFNPDSIRKTSQKLSLRTESSMRFEKSLDPTSCAIALSRTVDLIKLLCPHAKIASDLIDENKYEINTGPVELDLKWLQKRIGEKIESRKVIKILTNLGFGVEKAEHVLKVTIPTWRAGRDIASKEDLLEEVARIYGYDKILPVMPKVEMKTPEINKERLLERKIKEILTGAPALAEVYNYSFVGEGELRKIGIEPGSYLKVLNPIAQNQSLLRQSLLPNLIGNIKTNQARFEEIKIFEIGSIFSPIDGNLSKNASGSLPYQERRLGIIIADNNGDVFKKVKGAIEALLGKLNIKVSFMERETNIIGASFKVNAAIIAVDKNIGLVIKLGAKEARACGLKKEVAYAEIRLKELFNLINMAGEKRYEPLGKFPFVSRDLAFVIDSKIAYNKIKDEIASFHELIKEAELFDTYEGEKLGRGKRSLAFHINYGTNRTLTSEEVDEIQKKLIKNLEEKFGAKVRDF